MRPLTREDIPRMVQVAVAAELFPPEAGGFLTEQATRWLDDGQGPGSWVVDELDGAIVGVAFHEPRLATDRVWSLTMLVVDPALQGTGRGSALLAWVEAELRRSGQRLLVIETSSTARYQQTRRFYAKNGYDPVAVVPDYFEDGDDMILFRKDLRR